MTVDRPASINVHNADPNSDTRQVALVGSPAGANKTCGGIPITANGASMVANNGTTEGFLYNLVAGCCSFNFETLCEVWGVHVQINAPNRMEFQPVACNGVSWRFYTSATTNYREYGYGGNDTVYGKYQNGPIYSVVCPTVYLECNVADSGSYNPASVIRYGHIAVGTCLGGSTHQSFLSKSQFVGHGKAGTNTIKVHGTSVQTSDIHADAFGTNRCNTFSLYTREPLPGIYIYSIGYQVGKAATTTTGNDLSQTCERATYISAANADPNQPINYMSNRVQRVYFVDGTNLTWTQSGVYQWNTRADFEVESGVAFTHDNATYSGTGLWKIDSSCYTGPAAWCNTEAVKVSVTGADIDGSTFTNSNATPILYAKQDDGGVFTDDVCDARCAECGTVQMMTNSAANCDAFYIGQEKEFCQIQLDMATAASGGTFVYEFFNGVSWVDLAETGCGISSTGVNEVTWTTPVRWNPHTVDGDLAHWMRIRKTAGTTTTGPIANSISAGLNRSAALVLEGGADTVSCLTFANNCRGIEITCTGTYTINNTCFCGCTIRVRNTSEGAVTLTLSGTSISCAQVESIGAGSITISKSQTTTITVLDSNGCGIQNARVGVFTSPVCSGDSAEICGNTNACGIFSDTTNETSPLAVTIRVRKKGYIPFETTGTIDDTNGLTLTASLQDDTAVNLP